MRVTLFTDLNCPFCYSTEQRLERLGVSDQVVWRGVEHEPELPVPMARGDSEDRRRGGRGGRVRAVAGPRRRHRGAAREGEHLRRAARDGRRAAHRREKGAAFRQAVYRAFWRDGRDISEPAVLDELADAVGSRRPAAARGRADRHVVAPGMGALAAPRRAAARTRGRRDRLRAEGRSRRSSGSSAPADTRRLRGQGPGGDGREHSDGGALERSPTAAPCDDDGPGAEVCQPRVRAGLLVVSGPGRAFDLALPPPRGCDACVRRAGLDDAADHLATHRVSCVLLDASGPSSSR